MTKYLLDTNITAYIEDKGSLFHRPVEERLSKLSNSDEVFVSLLTLYEIHYGIAYAEKRNVKGLWVLENAIKDNFYVFPLTEKGAEIFGILKAAYRNKFGGDKKELGQHDFDFLIATTAICENAVLVSNDRMFRELLGFYKDFRLENWAVE